MHYASTSRNARISATLLDFAGGERVRERRNVVRDQEARLLTVLQIAQVLLNVIWWIVAGQVILSLLIGFNVVNTYNDFVSSLWKALNAVTEPMYRPIRKILPDTGSIDFSPAVVLILLSIVTNILIPSMARSLITSGAM